MEFQAQSGQGPPPSSTDKVVKRLFVDSASQPLKIFVEPSEVDQRPKVVRTLKVCGPRCQSIRAIDALMPQERGRSALRGRCGSRHSRSRAGDYFSQTTHRLLGWGEGHSRRGVGARVCQEGISVS